MVTPLGQTTNKHAQRPWPPEQVSQFSQAHDESRTPTRDDPKCLIYTTTLDACCCNLEGPQEKTESPSINNLGELRLQKPSRSSNEFLAQVLKEI